MGAYYFAIIHFQTALPPVGNPVPTPIELGIGDGNVGRLAYDPLRTIVESAIHHDEVGSVYFDRVIIILKRRIQDYRSRVRRVNADRRVIAPVSRALDVRIADPNVVGIG